MGDRRGSFGNQQRGRGGYGPGGGGYQGGGGGRGGGRGGKRKREDEVDDAMQPLRSLSYAIFYLGDRKKVNVILQDVKGLP